MIENLTWNFPKSGKTTLNSSDNNNIDTFSDDRIGNLVREILQNSLDACLNDQAVRVEFRAFKTKTNIFPGLVAFRAYLENWKNTQLDLDPDDKETIFVNRALEQLSKEEMVWLRISDFNTTGLWGSTSSSPKTPYFSFVHGAGKNSKQSLVSGGSKGVGKNAILANSELQTMFVSTSTKDNEEAFIGISFLVSSDENNINNDWTLGIGFCVKDDQNKEQNKPVPTINDIDPTFDRRKHGYGTDIYIPCFIDDHDWIKQMSGQVIYSFLPAIIKKRISIKIIDGLGDLGFDSELEINSSNISALVNQTATYKSRFQKDSCQNIYNSLTDANKKKIVYDSKPGFKMSMYLLEDDYSGDNKLYVYRCPTRMFIKSYDINAFVKCTGVLFIEGEELAQRLRSIEDGTHSKWSKLKYNKTKYTLEEITEALDAVDDFIDKKANNFGNNEMATESDFDYMVENDWCSADDDHEITRESVGESGLPISRATFSIRNDPSKHSRKKKPLKRKSNKRTDEDSGVTNYVEIEGVPGQEDDAMLLINGRNKSSDGENLEGTQEGSADETNNGIIVKSRKAVEIHNIKISSVNPKDGLFNLIFIPKNSGDDVEVELFIIGTGINDNIPVTILKAKTGIFPLKTKKNKFYLKRIERGSKYKVSLKLDVNQNYVWEVNVSANE